MKKHLGKIVAVLLGIVGIVVMFVRGLFDPKSVKHEAAKLDVEAKKADVEVKKADVKVVEAEAAAVHERVEEKLAALEDKAKEDAARDSVDVANELIKGA